MIKIKERITWYFEAVWRVEKLRYQKKGLTNSIIGAFLLFCMFYFIPNICRPYWPTQIEDMFIFQLKWQWAILFFPTLGYFFLYLPGYMGAKAYKKYEISNVQKVWEKSDWPEMRWKMIEYYVISNGILFPIYLYAGSKLAGVNFMIQGFPTNWELFKTVTCLLIVDDLLNTTTHYLFHQIPFLYKYHKVHHSAQANLTFVGNYLHPVEHYLSGVIPATFGVGLFQPHLFIVLFWYGFKLFNASQGHSGYEFPWDPLRVYPFIYGNSYHEFHHRINQGNFAPAFYLIELASGTNELFFKEEFKKYGLEWVPMPPLFEQQKKQAKISAKSA